VTLRTTTTYGIKSSVPPKLRGGEGKVNILFVQLIKQPQTLRSPSTTAWLSNERPAYLYDIMQLGAGPSYRNTTISRHERDKRTFISAVYGRSRSSASFTIQWHKYQQPPFTTWCPNKHLNVIFHLHLRLKGGRFSFPAVTATKLNVDCREYYHPTPIASQKLSDYSSCFVHRSQVRIQLRGTLYQEQTLVSCKCCHCTP